MSKIQCMVSLLLFIIVVFSMALMFGNPLRETFKGGMMGLANIGRGQGVEGVGADLDYKPIVRQNTLNGNMGYPSAGFLAGNIPAGYKINSDDQPLHYSFSF